MRQDDQQSQGAPFGSGSCPSGGAVSSASSAKPSIPGAAPDWELCTNSTSSAELRQLAEEVFELSRKPRKDDRLESRVNMACNAMMNGDSGWTFTGSHRGALGFISQLLALRASELDRLRPSYCRVASADTHPKGGDSVAAPFMSGAVPKGDATPSDPSPHIGD